MKNKFNIRGEQTAVFVSYQGEVLECLIDTKSLEKLHDFEGTFRAVFNEYTKTHYVMGYDNSFTPKKSTMIHRYLMDAEGNCVVDHINHDTLDNRLCNLRKVSQSINMMNPDPSKITRKNVLGVTWYESKKKWRVRCSGTHLGYFEDHDEAVEVLKSHKK